MTPEERKALKDKVKAGNAERASKLAEFNSAAADARLANEAKLQELEVKHNRTLGLDMGVVWCSDGSMAVVVKPDLVDYEKFIFEKADATAKETPALLDAYLKPFVVFPAWGREFNDLYERYGDVKLVAAGIMSSMHDVTKGEVEGKS